MGRILNSLFDQDTSNLEDDLEKAAIVRSFSNNYISVRENCVYSPFDMIANDNICNIPSNYIILNNRSIYANIDHDKIKCSFRCDDLFVKTSCESISLRTECISYLKITGKFKRFQDTDLTMTYKTMSYSEYGKTDGSAYIDLTDTEVSDIDAISKNNLRIIKDERLESDIIIYGKDYFNVVINIGGTPLADRINEMEYQYIHDNISEHISTILAYGKIIYKKRPE